MFTYFRQIFSKALTLRYFDKWIFRGIILCFPLLLPLSQLHAQDEEEYVTFPIQIDSLRIIGNEKTRDAVILRQIPYNFPDTLELNDIQIIRNRITNLFLFNRVELTILGEGDKNILLVQVAEIYYIYPLPILFLNDREWDKISLGFQLTHVNFRGMHERLSIGGWLGYNPSFFLRYGNPWLTEQRYIFGVNFFGKRVNNKTLQVTDARVDETHLGGSLSFGKRFGLNTTLTAKLGLRQIDLPDNLDFLQDLDDVDQRQRLTSEFTPYLGRNVHPKVDLTFRIDQRDLFEYPKKGYYLRWIGSRAGFTENQAKFWRFSSDHRAYIPLNGRISLGLRNKLVLNSDDLPIYDQVYIGFGERVRGYFDRVASARNLMTHNAELRISLLPVRYFSLRDAPEIAKKMVSQLKYGLSLGLFADSGVVWNESSELSLKRHFSGFGAGLHVHLPYVYLLRFDLAFNDKGDSEFIIEGGVTF